jgi:hypothetical protein
VTASQVYGSAGAARDLIILWTLLASVAVQVWHEASRSLTHIKGLPVDPDRMYSVAVTFQALDGLDNIAPLVEYRRAHADQLPKSAEAGKGVKEILVTHYSVACL